eukprot:1158972-Pelagomonas_calceolata.AAC.2
MDSTCVRCNASKTILVANKVMRVADKVMFVANEMTAAAVSAACMHEMPWPHITQLVMSLCCPLKQTPPVLVANVRR